MFRLVFFYSFCFLVAMGPGDGFSQTIVNPRYLADNKQPEYPTMSLRLGEIGTVVLRIVVTKTGTVGGVEVKSSSAFRRLDDAAVFAARNWKFEPALKNGVAVEKEIEMPVTFKLPQGVVATAEPGNGRFIWPTDGKVIRSFDAFHKGIDIAGQPGQPIVAVQEGIVLYANHLRDFGNLVIIDHRDGLASAYGHNKVILVQEGQTVAKGQRIAEMGDSDAESVRLHFEIRQLGKAVDPMGFLQSR